MTTHPLIDQYRFTRSEFRRSLAGVNDDDARHRFGPINSISWMICHMAAHERSFWLVRAQGIERVAPELEEWGANGKPATTPPLAAAWEAWDAVIAAVDPYFDTLSAGRVGEHLVVGGRSHPESIGTMLLRGIYHYWFHTGEASAVRQLLGHTGLPDFVGAIGRDAPYRPDPSTGAAS